MTFQIIDLISQALAIEEKFVGKFNAEIIQWLQHKGKVQKSKK